MKEGDDGVGHSYGNSDTIGRSKWFLDYYGEGWMPFGLVQSHVRLAINSMCLYACMRACFQQKAPVDGGNELPLTPGTGDLGFR